MMKQEKILFGGLRSLQRELGKAEWEEARFVILLDENTFQYCLPRLVGSVEELEEAEFIEVPVGEECKSLEIAQQVWNTMLDDGCDRNTVLVCLGGGCVCDLGGFVAAGYMRGIRHVNIPTTLIGMADAAIGGKTAVNLNGVKNIIGNFYPAELTVIEPAFIATLPQEEILSGYFEMVKTAAVTDADLYNHLLQPVDGMLTPPDIKAVARIKTRVVKFDPYDKDIRHILNFGHTFGHAIEAYSLQTGKPLSHGIAVGIGMLPAMYLSVHKIGLQESTYLSYSKWIKQHIKLPAYNLKDIEALLALMHHDKKNADGDIRCILLQEPGAAMIDVSVTDNEIRDAFLKLER